VRRGAAALALAIALAPGLARAQRASEVFGGQEIAAPRGSIPYLKRIPTDGEIKVLLATSEELRSVSHQPAVDNGPLNFHPETPGARVKDVSVAKWHMPGVAGPTRGSFAVLKMTSVLLREDGQETALAMMQAVFLGYRKPDGPLAILHGFLPGDKPGQMVAPPIVEGRSAEERDRQLAQVIAGAEPGFAPGVPERVQISVSSAVAKGGTVHVEGSILSGTPITSTLFMRSEGGELKQGFIELSGEAMTASCEMAPRVANVFRITADNEARLGGEFTLTFDANGKLVGAKVTSAEGDLTTDAPGLTGPEGGGSVAGLGGVGNVPGPATQGQAAAGILTPALLAILLHGLLGGGGGGGTTPPVPPGGKGTRHHGAGTPSGAEGEGGEEGGEEGREPGGKSDAGGKGKGSGPVVKPTAPGGAPKEAPKGAEPKTSGSKPNAPPPGAVPPGPTAAGPTAAEKEATDKLAWLENRAKRSHSPELTKALAEAKQSCIRPDGRLDLARWKASQRGLWEAVGAYGRQGEEPNSYLGDAGREIGYAPVQAARMAGGAAVDLVKGIGGLAVSGAKGIRDIGDGLLHPGTFLSGAKTKTNEWVAKNCPEESKALQQAAIQGRPLDALAAMGRTAAKAGGQLLGSAAHFVKTEVLPVDEIGSFFDKDASLEERLWAVPAAATKIAGLLLGGAKVTTVPSTRLGTAIQGAAQRQGLAATEAAAAQQAARLEAQVTSLQKAAARAEGKAGGVHSVLDRTEKALEGARQARDSAKAVQRVQETAPRALEGAPPIQNLKDAMRRLDGNPELTKAADEAIRANGGGSALYKQRVEGNMSQDTHTLLTARKVQLQNEAISNATKRILEEDVAARMARGEAVPGRYSTFNASQGSRARISGANVNVDYDQTIVGLRGHETEAARRAASDRVKEIVRQECGRLRQSPESLDVNVYTPQRGLADASGAAPNAQATLENIGQTTGTAGHHSVHIARDNRIVVGDHVSTMDGREGVLAGRRNMEPPPGVSRDQWLREGVWEGQQGRPIQVPREEWPAVRQAQMDGLHHALERGDMNQMVKYANRARTVGLPVSESTERLLRAVAGQKDPYIAQQLLSEAGVASPADLMQKLGLS
jgi:hypothetical protein